MRTRRKAILPSAPPPRTRQNAASSTKAARRKIPNAKTPSAARTCSPLDPSPPDYSILSNRIASFSNWPHPNTPNLSPRNMALCGFIYIPPSQSGDGSPDKDGVQCFKCKKELTGWCPETDHPSTVHLERSAICSYALAVCGPISWSLAYNVPWVPGKPSTFPASNHMVSARRATFDNRWPFISKSCRKTSLEMAKSGFVYAPYPINDSQDAAKCAYCNVILSSWEPTDNPTFEHQTRNPTCPFFTDPASLSYLQPGNLVSKPQNNSSNPGRVSSRTISVTLPVPKTSKRLLRSSIASSGKSTPSLPIINKLNTRLLDSANCDESSDDLSDEEGNLPDVCPKMDSTVTGPRPPNPKQPTCEINIVLPTPGKQVLECEQCKWTPNQPQTFSHGISSEGPSNRPAQHKTKPMNSNSTRPLYHLSSLNCRRTIEIVVPPVPSVSRSLSVSSLGSNSQQSIVGDMSPDGPQFEPSNENIIPGSNQVPDSCTSSPSISPAAINKYSSRPLQFENLPSGSRRQAAVAFVLARYSPQLLAILDDIIIHNPSPDIDVNQSIKEILMAHFIRVREQELAAELDPLIDHLLAMVAQITSQNSNV